MSRRYRLTGLLLALAYLMPVNVQAEIYKCVAENGELTFSQAPCPEKGSKVTVVKTGGGSAGEPADCDFARRFALSTAEQMRSGTASTTVFDSYGGLGALTKGSVSLISYVYQFRTNDDISAVRVSGLAAAKCQARALGDVSCEQLPASFTNRIGGCETGDREAPPVVAEDAGQTGAQDAYQLNTGSQLNGSNSRETNAEVRARERKAKAAENERRMQCKESIDNQIERINKQMRGGYSSSQGESLKSRRRDLEERKRDC